MFDSNLARVFIIFIVCLVQYLMPFVEKERYRISTRCRLHPDNDVYRDQEQHKFHKDTNEWKCGYCKKKFYEEKYLDRHFDNRHYNLLNEVCHVCVASTLTFVFVVMIYEF